MAVTVIILCGTVLLKLVLPLCAHISIGSISIINWSSLSFSLSWHLSCCPVSLLACSLAMFLAWLWTLVFFPFFQVCVSVMYSDLLFLFCSVDGVVDDLPPIAAASMWTRKDFKEFKDSLRKDKDSVIKIGSGETVTVSTLFFSK